MNVSLHKSLEQPINIYAGYIYDTKLRSKSASGGAFTAFAQLFYSIERGMVAAAAFDDHLYLRHILSSDERDLSRFQGSKYLQSEVGNIYRKIYCSLKQGSSILFVGTPCQVAGLKSFLRKDYEHLYTLDLVCHGVPSPSLFHSYLRQVGIDSNEEYYDFFFRSRENSAFFHHSVYTKDGVVKHINPNQHSYICAYLKGWIHRESCYNCPFAAIPRQGDCTIADFWGVLAKKVHFNGDTSKGVSMIMVNTPKGHVLFEQVKSSFYLEEKSLEEAMIDNHNLYRHDERPVIRDFVYRELLETKPEEFMTKYDLHLPLPPSRWKQMYTRIKRLFGL